MFLMPANVVPSSACSPWRQRTARDSHEAPVIFHFYRAPILQRSLLCIWLDQDPLGHSGFRGGGYSLGSSCQNSVNCYVWSPVLFILKGLKLFCLLTSFSTCFFSTGLHRCDQLVGLKLFFLCLAFYFQSLYHAARVWTLLYAWEQCFTGHLETKYKVDFWAAVGTYFENEDSSSIKKKKKKVLSLLSVVSSQHSVYAPCYSTLVFMSIQSEALCR